MTTQTEMPQHLWALHRANAVRFANSALLKELRIMDRCEAHRVAVELVLSPSPQTSAIKVRSLLSALPGRGPIWVNRAMMHVGLSNQSVASLTPRKREELAATIPKHLRDMRPSGTPIVVGDPVAREVTKKRVDDAAEALRPYVSTPMLYRAARAALTAALQDDAG